MQIGLFFGSFNPVHNGHLIIANHILNETALTKIWFIVSPQNPFKESGYLLSDDERLHLATKAVNDDSRITVSDIEFQLPKPSYTVTTLARLKEKYPEHKFFIVMGSDSFQSLEKWKNYEIIVQNYPLIIYKRPAYEINNNHGAQIEIMDAPLLEISATYIRELVRRKKSIKYLVPEAIEQEVQNNKFYLLQNK